MGASECIARNDRAVLERLLALLCQPTFALERIAQVAAANGEH